MSNPITKETLEDLKELYEMERQMIEDDCISEGYPSRGANYELRVENLQRSYPELFGREEDQ